MDQSDNQNPPGKKTTRKKLVDLKAVAALLDDGDAEGGDEGNVHQLKKAKAGSYAPNEELIQATARIKNQRDLISSRLQKMESNRGKVSKTVFNKVNRDYMMQLESITKILAEKKDLLNAELKDLYLMREKHTVDTNRHKEILEEARFRHFLEEFSEEQFKEVEEYESREITNLGAVLAQIQSYIKLHEELFDPQDLDYSVTTKKNEHAYAKSETAEPTKTIIPPIAKTEPVAPKAEVPLPAEPEQKALVVEQTDEIQINPEAAKNAGVAETRNTVEEDVLVPEPLDESDYFRPADLSDPSITAPATRTATPKRDGFDELTPPPSAKKLEEPESIFDVLEDVQLESGPEQKEEPASSVTELGSEPPSAMSKPVSVPTVEGHAGQYHLVFTEMVENLGMSEYVLRDNVSIGRSPSNDLVLKAAKVSRQHAAINKYKNQFLIIDLKSSNGVFVNGKKVEEHTLENNDEISIGGYKMIFKAPA